MRLDGSPVHHSIVVVDIERFGNPGRNDLHRVTAHNGLYTALRQALVEANIDPDSCTVQDRGDGALILVPAAVSRGRLVDHLPPRLNACLLRYNATSALEARIRLRMSLHAGDARMAEHGIVGNAVNFACRLVDSDNLRQVQRESNELISIIVSDSFYREVVLHEPAAQPNFYYEVLVREKEVDTTAWIRYEHRAVQNSISPAQPLRLLTRASQPAQSETGWQARMWVDDSADQTSLWPLVQALSQVPALAGQDGRDLLVRMLGDELRERLLVHGHQQTFVHLFDIAEVCREHPDGLTALVEVLSRIAHDDASLVEVRRVVREMTALELWPAEERQRLFTLLAGVVVPEIAEIYRAVAGSAAPGLREQTTYLEVFRALERLNAGPSGVPKPLVFVEHVAARVRPELAIELRRWSDQQAARMDLQTELECVRQDLRNAARKAPTLPSSSDAYLVIQLQHEGSTGDHYRLSHWRQLDLSSGWAPIRGKDVTGGLASMKHQVAALIEQVEGDWVQYQPDIRVEFVLDYENLNLDVDQWPWETESPVAEPLGCRYPVTVRSLERMASVKYHGSWRKRWDALHAQVDSYGAIPPIACCQRRTPGIDGLRELMSEFNRKPELVALVLSEPPLSDNAGTDEIAVGVRAGVPIIVWHRGDCRSPEFIASMDDLLHKVAGSGHLLERVRLARIVAFEEGPAGRHFGGQLTMLYDDPFRVVIPSQPTCPEGMPGA